MPKIKALHRYKSRAILYPAGHVFDADDEYFDFLQADAPGVFVEVKAKKKAAPKKKSAKKKAAPKKSDADQGEDASGVEQSE